MVATGSFLCFHSRGVGTTETRLPRWRRFRDFCALSPRIRLQGDMRDPMQSALLFQPPKTGTPPPGGSAKPLSMHHRLSGQQPCTGIRARAREKGRSPNCSWRKREETHPKDECWPSCFGGHSTLGPYEGVLLKQPEGGNLVQKETLKEQQMWTFFKARAGL